MNSTCVQTGLTETALQQIQTASGSFFGGIASYPLQGGYIYFCPTGGPLQAWSYGLNTTNGNPLFTLAGTAATTGLACSGMPTVTSFNNQPGTAVVSITLIADTIPCNTNM